VEGVLVVWWAFVSVEGAVESEEQEEEAEKEEEEVVVVVARSI
jgi:hypothetical protein